MGLDCSHGAWHGAYSAFMRWREKLAEVAGLPPLDLMEGFFRPEEELVRVHDMFKDWGQRRIQRLPIQWSCLKRDPLHTLLNHSDCDGSISPRQLKGIARRLQELLPLLPDEDSGGHIGNWREKTQTFIDGCLLAISERKSLLFR